MNYIPTIQFADESLFGILIDPSNAFMYPLPVPKYTPELSCYFYYIKKFVFEYSVDIWESIHVATEALESCF